MSRYATLAVWAVPGLREPVSRSVSELAKGDTAALPGRTWTRTRRTRIPRANRRRRVRRAAEGQAAHVDAQLRESADIGITAARPELRCSKYRVSSR
jgi:hypothetical protein